MHLGASLARRTRAGLWSAEDHYLLPDYMLETYRYMRAPWRAERIDEASHFLMLDQPQRVTKLILDFFNLKAAVEG